MNLNENTGDPQVVELQVESPSYSVRRLLSALDGITSSDDEFAIQVDYQHRGGDIVIVNAIDQPILRIQMRGIPDSDEAALDFEERERTEIGQ